MNWCRLCNQDVDWVDEDDLCEECLAEYEHECEIRSDYFARLI